MKQLITAVAAVTLILALIVEIVSSQIYFMKIIKADYIMSLHNDGVRQEGGIVESCEENIKGDLSEIFGCTKDEVNIIYDASSVPMNDKIIYMVRVNAGTLFNSKFWGLKSNSMKYEREFVLVSKLKESNKGEIDDYRE